MVYRSRWCWTLRCIASGWRMRVLPFMPLPRRG